MLDAIAVGGVLLRIPYVSLRWKRLRPTALCLENFGCLESQIATSLSVRPCALAIVKQEPRRFSNKLVRHRVLGAGVVAF